MRYEGLEVPTYILGKGVQKLLKYGTDVFDLFADEANLSFCDRNRIISKCKIAYGRENLKETGCPPDLKQERWEFYTKKLRFADDKARKLIKQIDESYEDQFNPVIPKGFEIGSRKQLNE